MLWQESHQATHGITTTGPRTLPSSLGAIGNFGKKHSTKLLLLVTHLPSTSLQEPLGSWLVNPSNSWQWFYDPISNALYHKTDDEWQAYTPTSSRSTHSTRPTNKAFKLNQEFLSWSNPSALCMRSKKVLLKWLWITSQQQNSLLETGCSTLGNKTTTCYWTLEAACKNFLSR
jgi:hypothetical protein